MALSYERREHSLTSSANAGDRRAAEKRDERAASYVEHVAPPRNPLCQLTAALGCTGSAAIGDSDLINVRFGPLCRLKSDNLRGPRSAASGLMQCSKTRSFDNIISARKQCRWQFEAERLGGLEVDEQLNLCGLLDGQIGQLLIL